MIQYVAMPWPNDDVDAYIDIYKQAMNVPSKTEVMAQLYQIKELQGTQNEQAGVWNAQAGAMSMNNINQQSNASIWATPWI